MQETLPDCMLSTKLIMFGARNIFSGGQAGRCLIPPLLCVCRAQMSHKDNRGVFHQISFSRGGVTKE